jgi:hypothetical protein
VCWRDIFIIPALFAAGLAASIGAAISRVATSDGCHLLLA